MWACLSEEFALRSIGIVAYRSLILFIPRDVRFSTRELFRHYYIKTEKGDRLESINPTLGSILCVRTQSQVKSNTPERRAYRYNLMCEGTSSSAKRYSKTIDVA